MPLERERKHDQPTRRERVISAVRRAVGWADRKLPRGVRSVLGLLLIVAGVFGFLPILGFWMIPLGIALIALDFPPLRRRLFDWLERQRTDRLH
jgi:hypothetical protein